MSFNELPYEILIEDIVGLSSELASINSANINVLGALDTKGAVVPQENKNYFFTLKKEDGLIAINSKGESVVTAGTAVPYTRGIDLPRGAYAGMAFNGQAYVAYSEKGYVSYSNDAVNWSVYALPSSIPYASKIAYGNGAFVIVMRGQSYVFRSTDGKVWETYSAPWGLWDAGFTFGNNKFIAVDEGGSPILTQVMHSEDGITWTVSGQGVIDIGYCQSIAAGNGIYVVGSKWNRWKIAYSYDLVTWQTVDVFLDNMVLAYGEGLFVMLSNNWGGGYYSFDGITWTNQSSTIGYGWRNISYLKNIFVATSSNNVIASCLRSYPNSWQHYGTPISGFISPVFNGNIATYKSVAEVFGV